MYDEIEINQEDSVLSNHLDLISIYVLPMNRITLRNQLHP